MNQSSQVTDITVYGRADCIQCHFTCKFLSDNDIPFTYVDVDHASTDLPASMPLQLPYVVAPRNMRWSGYKRERLKMLAVTYGKP